MADRVFPDIGEMGRMCRGMDWAATPLGPVEAWPSSLRTAAGMVIGWGFPGIVLWGAELVQIYNDGYIAVHGAKHPWALGRPTREVWPEVWSLNEPLFRRAMAGEQVRLDAAPYRLARGGTDAEDELVYVDLSFSPILDESGGTGGVFVSLNDVTEEHTAHTLAAGEERYRLMFRSNPQPMWVFDVETLEFLDVNQAAVHLYGYSREEFLAMTISDIRPPEDVPALVESLQRERASYEGPRQWRHLRRDGSVVWVEISSHLLDFDNRRAELILAVDVTRQKQAQEALTRSERYYRSLIENATDLITILQADGTITYQSPSIESVLGWSQDELVGRSAFDLVHPEDAAQARTLFRNAIASSEPVRVLYRFQRSDGSWAILESTGSNLLHDDAVNGVVVNSRDVTEQQTARQQLEDQATQLEIAVRSIQKAARAVRGSEERFRALVEHATESVAIIDHRRNVLYQSPALSRVLGYAGDELSVISVADLIHPDDVAMVEGAFADALRQPGTPVNIQTRARARDGTWRYVDATLTDLSHDPAVRGIVVNSRDITDRIGTEQRLRESEARYRRFFMDDLTGDFIARPDGNIIDCNRAFAHIFGFADEDEARQSNILMLYRDPAKRASFLSQLRNRGMLELIEITLERRDGRAVEVIANIVGEFSRDGELAEIKGYLFDITERKALEKQLAQAQKMEVVGRLAGGIAHDFNNLLTVIRGNAQMLQLEEGQPPHDSVTEIDRAAERAAELTRQLLAFSRQQVLLPRAVDLHHSLRDMRRMLERLIGEDVLLQLDMVAGVWPVRVDPGQLQQVVMNLIVNARDAMPDGGRISVQTRNVPAAEAALLPLPTPAQDARDYVELLVVDDGEGIDPGTMEHIFEPFFTTKEQGKGTGLGLSTVYGIVAQSEGHIWVESERGVGTIFHVLLPRAAGEQVEPPVRRSVLSDLPGGSETVLVVEDEEGVRTIVSLTLRTRGYNVLRAADGNEAIGICRSHEGAIDLLLTDVVMPGMSGVVLQSHLATMRPHMRVLFMSGYTADAIDYHGAARDGIELLQKPFTPEELLLRVRAVLDARAAG